MGLWLCHDASRQAPFNRTDEPEQLMGRRLADQCCSHFSSCLENDKGLQKSTDAELDGKTIDSRYVEIAGTSNLALFAEPYFTVKTWPRMGRSHAACITKVFPGSHASRTRLWRIAMNRLRLRFS